LTIVRLNIGGHHKAQKLGVSEDRGHQWIDAPGLDPYK